MMASGAEATAGATNLEDSHVRPKANAHRASRAQQWMQPAARGRSSHAAVGNVTSVRSVPIALSGRSAVNGPNVVSGLSGPSVHVPKPVPSSKAKAVGVAVVAGEIAVVVAEMANPGATSTHVRRDWTLHVRNP
jgi:hypothetical protein